MDSRVRRGRGRHHAGDIARLAERLTDDEDLYLQAAKDAQVPDPKHYAKPPEELRGLICEKVQQMNAIESLSRCRNMTDSEVAELLHLRGEVHTLRTVAELIEARRQA